ncbi:protein of unknown function [Limimonas halophila]|uniref:DUF4396 domain-containing protein n=1 Tax=Limimonas halophila TaxID=1082479 RepID=A0A1G7R991_9PROT|nr:DUF4396 domain-containing protein [Limimonas halophila]SDG07376.1 protein of unknown function [Limimonas halophila]
MTGWLLLAGWIAVVAASLAALMRDLARNNPEIHGLMKVVWVLTVAYSGPLGLAIYHYAGRKQIQRDDIWRRAFRSVSHCYSGCGLGEIVGLLVAVGLLGLSTVWTAGLTFACAYIMGFALTMGPLIQGGERVATAFVDTVTSETASIAVMETVAIGVDLTLAGGAGLAEPLFWGSLIVSLTVGLAAAYPVNVVLIRLGVKEGMHDPRAHAAA